jgi:hypothetical protein
MGIGAPPYACTSAATASEEAFGESDDVRNSTVASSQRSYGEIRDRRDDGRDDVGGVVLPDDAGEQADLARPSAAAQQADAGAEVERAEQEDVFEGARERARVYAEIAALVAAEDEVYHRAPRKLASVPMEKRSRLRAKST